MPILANGHKLSKVRNDTERDTFWTISSILNRKRQPTEENLKKKNVLWLPRMVAHAGVTISSLCWLFLFYYIFSDYFFSLLCCLTMVCYIHLCIMSVVAAVVAIVVVVVTKYSRCSTQTDRLIPTHIHTVCNTDALVSRNSHKTFIQCFFLFYIRIVRKTKMKKRIFYIWYYTNVYNNIESICDVLSLSLARFIYLLFSVIMSDSTQNVFIFLHIHTFVKYRTTYNRITEYNIIPAARSGFLHIIVYSEYNSVCACATLTFEWDRAKNNI